MGKLYFSYGTMNSGKSLFLLANAHSFEERNIPFLCIKPSIDTRNGSGVIYSRALDGRECMIFSPEDNLYTIFGVWVKNDNIKWILVDESQFLTEKQVEELAQLVDEYNINVKCYGLRTDFRTKLFPGSKRLFELADTIDELKSTCSCGNKNIVNSRVDNNGNVIVEGEQVMIGGEDKYLSMCRKCYMEKVKQIN